MQEYQPKAALESLAASSDFGMVEGKKKKKGEKFTDRLYRKFFVAPTAAQVVELMDADQENARSKGFLVTKRVMIEPDQPCPCGSGFAFRDCHEGSRDAADPAGSSHRARSASEAEPALRCEASARGVRRLANYE